MYVIRNATRHDMDFIIGLADHEGWNPGLSDGEYFFHADQNGFFIGELSGEPIGCISAVSYGSFGFIGLYIVKEEYRKKGYGLALWNHAVQRLKGCNIGLDGVTAQQDNYKKSGFRLAHRNLRFEGVFHAPPPRRTDIVPAEKVAFQALADYDALHFPSDRKAFLSHWIRMPGALTLVCQKDGVIYGYGTIRPCRRGYKIGPLFAENCELADALLLSLAHFAGQSPVYLDIPETNESARTLCQQYRMVERFETARMYTGDIPNARWNNVYGITTFELG